MKSCIIKSVKEKITDNVREHLLRGAPSYKLIGDDIIILVTENRSKKDCLNLAVSEIKKVNKLYQSQRFGPVAFLNDNYEGGAGIRINPSKALLDAYEVKNGTRDINNIAPKPEDSITSEMSVPQVNEMLEDNSTENKKEDTNVENYMFQILENSENSISFEQLDEVINQQEDSFNYDKNCI